MRSFSVVFWALFYIKIEFSLECAYAYVFSLECVCAYVFSLECVYAYVFSVKMKDKGLLDNLY